MFLRETLVKLHALGWELGNADITILAEKPKLGASKAIIRDSVAKLLGVPPDRVNVKAKIMADAAPPAPRSPPQLSM